MTLGEKASYVKGLIEGFDFDKDKKEGKAILAIADLLEDMAGSIGELENNVDDITDHVDDLSDEVSAISENICTCNHKNEKSSNKHKESDLFYEVTCPACNAKSYLTEETVTNNDVNCPNCGQKIDIYVDDSCDCEDCECDDCECDDRDCEGSGSQESSSSDESDD